MRGLPAGTIYRAGTRPGLTPRDVRARSFRSTALGRRGLEPRDVHLFLGRVADELAALHTELARCRDENIRIKRALRDWQTARAGQIRP
jgi:DivIVA domain-containing protein